MFNSIDRIISFDDSVLRNTPAIKLNFNVFDDLSDDVTAWDVAKQATDLSNRFNNNELQYNAIDFVFMQSTWQPSRFGDGSFPVWYGALELATTFTETIFHWQQTILNDVAQLWRGKKFTKPLYTARTVFNANCQSTLVDLRGKESAVPALTQPSLYHYQDTQKIGSKLAKEGMPGLITPSARQVLGNNVAIFNKAVLKSPSHAGDFLYEITPDNRHEVKILNYHTRELVA